MPDQRPSIGRIVHYVTHGSKECRAAIVTALHADDGAVDLAALSPNTMAFHLGVWHDAGGETPGDPECPLKASHGSPFRYCGCGWMEASLKGGTWHWPERV